MLIFGLKLQDLLFVIVSRLGTSVRKMNSKPLAYSKVAQRSSMLILCRNWVLVLINFIRNRSLQGLEGIKT